MRKRIFEPEQENESLKRRQLDSGKKRVSRYVLIDKEKGIHLMGQLYRAIKVSEDAFYAWDKGETYRLNPQKKASWQQRSKKFFT